MAFGDGLNKPPPRPHVRAALFIDGANMYAAAKNLDFQVDWDKVLAYYQKKYDLVRAYYYTAIPDGPAVIRPMVDHLEFNGYTVKTKPTKEFKDINGRVKIKGNMDMDMALDAVDAASFVSDIFLFTGDGDFRILAERLQQRGVRVHVLSTIQTDPPMIADELRRQADFYYDLGDFREQFHRGSR